MVVPQRGPWPCPAAPCVYSLGAARSGALGCCSSSRCHLLSWVGGRNGIHSKLFQMFFPWLRLRFRCSCAAPDAVQRRWQGWAWGGPHPDGSKGAGGTSGWAWKALGSLLHPQAVGSPLGGHGKLWSLNSCAAFPLCSVCMD